MSNKILVINCGSTSLKFAFFENIKPQLFGEVEEIATSNSKFWTKGALKCSESCDIKDHKNALKLVLKVLNECGITTIDAIGHRIVFGGNAFDKPAIIDKKVLQELKILSMYDPLHMPFQINIIELLLDHFSKASQIACFDTSFHLTMPNKAKMLALPFSMYEEGIKRYGFHGLSFESIVSHNQIDYKKMIIAHLGSGSSVCAVKNNKSIDTTMGFTPLGGVPMQARAGDLDPGVILFLLRQKKWPIEKLENLLYKDSGLKGISGFSSDMKTLLNRAKNNQKAQNAIDLFCYHIAKVIGSYIVSLQGLDAIVFTGGIGERAVTIRKNICAQLNPFEVHINDVANELSETIISSDYSKLKVLVIPAKEEEIIAKHVMRMLFA